MTLVRMRRAAVLAATLLLSGCMLTPSKPTRLDDSGIAIPSAWSTATTSTVPQDDDWVSGLGDPQLTTLVDEALAGNLDLRAAAARLQGARARARIAGAAELPRLDAGAGASRRGSGSGGRRSTASSFESTLSAAWDVDPWNRLADETRAAGLDALGSEADYAAARLTLVADVARAWFDLLEARAQEDLARETADTFRDNLAVVEEGFRGGLNDALDVRLERANLAGAESRLQARRLDRNAAVRVLEVLLGRYPGASVSTRRELPALAGPVPAGLPAAILDRRPDLRAARLRLAASDARVQAALKNRLPGLTLTTSGGLSSEALNRLLDFNSLLFAIAADLTAPLFRGGELEAQRDLARADTREALAIYAQAVLGAFREVENALTGETLLAEQELALRDAARESQAAEALALERYRSGLTDIVTWLEARRRAFDARSSLLSVSNQRLRNRIDLHQALGGSFSADTGAQPPLERPPS